MADRYGVIVTHRGGWANDAITELDRDLRDILQTFAIDPDRIALTGRCATGGLTAFTGAAYQDIFSRIIIGTEDYGDPPVRLPNQQTEYFVSGGMMETAGNFVGMRRRLRDRGYPVTYSLQFRGHSHEYEEYDYIVRWLQQSWTFPDPATRPTPYTFDDPPLLTMDIVARMTTFWAQFMAEPDSIRITARRAHVRDVLVPVGNERVLVLMVDMAALAKQVPSVAAALRAAGLTPEQHDSYRAALASARMYANAVKRSPVYKQLNTFHPVTRMQLMDTLATDSLNPFLGVTPTSAVVKNFEFLQAYPDEFQALADTKMWLTP